MHRTVQINLLCRLQDLEDTLLGECRGEDDWEVGERCHTVADSILEGLYSLRRLILHEVPFVDYYNETLVVLLYELEDFDTRADDHMLEVYRMQWINAKPGDEKDNYLLLYLALKQLNKEQDESENEWTQEQCEARMDEIIRELSEKTGLKLIENELSDTEFDAYFNSLPDEEDNESEE